LQSLSNLSALVQYDFHLFSSMLSNVGFCVERKCRFVENLLYKK
jgi:hypothetical protein